jgi:hypothetical protein
MTAKTAKNEMMQAHEAIAKVLDAKFANVPEWQAFRAIDRALLALEDEQPEPIKAAPQITHRPRIRMNGEQPSYMSLADQALTEAGKPVSTHKLMEYIGARRPLSGDDPEKARITVQSSLSKDKRFKSVPWDGKRAWWYADRPVPKKERRGESPAEPTS